MVRIHRGSKKRPESKDSGLFFILATMDSNRKVRRPRGGKAARDGGDRTLRRPGSDAHDARSWKANPSWLSFSIKNVILKGYGFFILKPAQLLPG